MTLVQLSHKRGQAPPPIETGTPVERTRSGDDVARQMFDVLTMEQVEPTPPHIHEWEKIQRLALSERPHDQTTASYLLDKITRGTTLQRHNRAKKAACLILHTLAGLTMEQLALAFDHPKGHISRLVRQAAEEFRQATADSDQRVDTETLLSQLSRDRQLTYRDRDRLKRRAQRVARKLFEMPASERAFFTTQLKRFL